MLITNVEYIVKKFGDGGHQKRTQRYEDVLAEKNHFPMALDAYGKHRYSLFAPVVSAIFSCQAYDSEHPVDVHLSC